MGGFILAWRAASPVSIETPCDNLRDVSWNKNQCPVITSTDLRLPLLIVQIFLSIIFHMQIFTLISPSKSQARN